MRYFFTYLMLIFLSACHAAEMSNPYQFPDHLFSRDIYEDKIPLPMNFLETLSHYPQDECEREDLRQLFIVADWQMNDFFNQSYYLKAESEGIVVLFKAFPELSDENILSENGSLVYSHILKERLLGIKTDCVR